MRSHVMNLHDRQGHRVEYLYVNYGPINLTSYSVPFITSSYPKMSHFKRRNCKIWYSIVKIRETT